MRDTDDGGHVGGLCARERWREREAERERERGGGRRRRREEGKGGEGTGDESARRAGKSLHLSLWIQLHEPIRLAPRSVEPNLH